MDMDMEKNNFDCRFHERDVENVSGSEDKKKTEHAPLSNHVAYRNKYFKNVSSLEDKKRADAWFKDGPGSPDFYRNMAKAMAQRSKAPKTRHPVKVVAIKTLLLRFKRRQSKQKQAMFKKDVENVTGSEDKKKTEDAPLKDAVSFRNRDVENGTDSDVNSEDEEWDYHLAKKKGEDARLKDVFSDVCETKDVICDRHEAGHTSSLCCSNRVVDLIHHIAPQTN